MSNPRPRAYQNDLARLLGEAGPFHPLVLIGHSEELWTRSIESVLAPHGYDTASAHSGEQILARASELEPDLLLLNVDLKDLTGVQVCRRLYLEHRISATTPVVITTATPPTRPERLAVLRAGAWEFLNLPRDREELLRKLTNFSRMKAEAYRTRHGSLVDPESGLYNGRGILRRMEEMGAYARRHHRALACITVAYTLRTSDVTRGSTVDLGVGEILRSASRASDAIGRMGRGTYVVLAPDTDLEGARRLAERYAAVLTDTPPGDAEGQPTDVHFGCCALADVGETDLPLVELLKRSLTALHSVEATGGTQRIQLFEPPADTA